MSQRKAPAKRAPKKKANAYKLPDPIKAGEILTDLAKKEWILGKSIGVGGFGEIYSAGPYNGKPPKEYLNVIKIEPHENGPLFVEIHFYMRIAKPNEIDNWRKKKNLSRLGMPPYIGSGSHEYNGTKYRFLVMDRYGSDLWKLFEDNNKKFPEHTVYKIAYQIVNVLEYMHHKGYVHADIKGANLVLDFRNQDQVYLVDFGLACRCKTKEYKPDPKRAHDGTLIYTSRDAHLGIPTMRGDLEILGYNILQWIYGSLPWETDKATPTSVQKQKEEAYKNISAFLNEHYHELDQNTVLKYMTLVKNLDYNEKPNYDNIRKIFADGLKQVNQEPNGKLVFALETQKVSVSPPKTRKGEPKAKPKPLLLEKLKANVPAADNLNESSVGIVLDKKRGGVRDIREVLKDIDSDEEYDIKIVKKARTKKAAASPRTVKPKRTTPVKPRNVKPKKIENSLLHSDDEKLDSSNKKLGTPATNKRTRTVKTKRSEDSLSDSEPEVISSGTRSRPTKIKKATSSKTNLRPGRLQYQGSNSDEDMFNSSDLQLS